MQAPPMYIGCLHLSISLPLFYLSAIPKKKAKLQCRWFEGNAHSVRCTGTDGIYLSVWKSFHRPHNWHHTDHPTDVGESCASTSNMPIKATGADYTLLK